MEIFKLFCSFFALLIGGCVTIFVVFFSQIKQQNNQLNEEVKDVYKAKKRQDEYDSTPIATKREWLRTYTSKKVSDLDKTSTKK